MKTELRDYAEGIEREKRNKDAAIRKTKRSKEWRDKIKK